MKELIFHRLFVPALKYQANEESIIDGAYSATFGEHADRTMRLCTALTGELGVGRTDRFAVMALNCHQYVELYHAAYLGAGVINPLNLRLAGKELDYIVRDSGTEGRSWTRPSPRPSPRRWPLPATTAPYGTRC